jgi:hypothetical protein
MSGKWISFGRPTYGRASALSVASSIAARVDILDTFLARGCC